MVPSPTLSSLAGFALAVIILTAGLAALFVMLSRRRLKDRILLWFGLFRSLLYGVRSREASADPGRPRKNLKDCKFSWWRGWTPCHQCPLHIR